MENLSALLPASVKGEFGLKKIQEELKLDLTVFPECQSKEKEIGRINKRIYYIHRYPDRWEILQISPEVKRYEFKDWDGFPTE